MVLTENCRNCGASPEPVCSYCGTVHDGMSYKQRNRRLAQGDDAGMKFYMMSTIGIRIQRPTIPYSWYLNI